MKLLRENIRKIRELRNYTQEYMADQLGLSVSGYGKIERSDSDINLSRITQIAEILNVSRTSLLEFNSEDLLKNLDEESANKSNNYTPVATPPQQNSLSHDDFSTLLDIIRSLREENAKLKAELEKLMIK
jgi:transcriptional regulator with XRE-family HTH domain